VVLSGTAGNETLGEDGSLAIYIGKNDFWGWPGRMLWHGSFQHYSPAFLTVKAKSTFFGAFESVMNFENGTISTAVSTSEGGVKLSLENVIVTPDRNTIVADLVADCRDGDFLSVDLSLQTDNPYSLPTTFAANGTRATLSKRAVHSKYAAPMLVSCSSNQIVYNSIRTWHVDDDGFVRALNGTETSLCFFAGGDGESVTVQSCRENDDEKQFKLSEENLITDGDVCLGTKYLGENSTDCPAESFPPPNPPCYTEQFKIVQKPLSACGDVDDDDDPNFSPFWIYDASTKFLESANAKYDSSQTWPFSPSPQMCLATVGELFDNFVFVDVNIDDTEWVVENDIITSKNNQLVCGPGGKRTITVGVASYRDGEDLHGSLSKHYSTGYVSNLKALYDATVTWWMEFNLASSVSLPAYPLVEKFYYGMQFAFRASNAIGEVPPGLWGPFNTKDTPDWADQMTLDYNFEANYWSAATSNHPELMRPYFDTVNSMMDNGRKRAALKDWSEGGYPNLFGGEVMGMSCGPTPLGNWDTDYGCPAEFGGFDGVEFSSSMGPFDGMQIFMDDGTRFVAGLTATPYIQYFESTLDGEFWRNDLFPLIDSVERFYSSYKEINHDGEYTLPYTCAQECCLTGGGATEKDNHQDLAYWKMVLRTLIAYATSDEYPNIDEKIVEWTTSLSKIVDYPRVFDELSQTTIFAEADIYANEEDMKPDSRSASGWCISHLAAIWPSQNIGYSIDDEILLADARSTVDVMNNATGWAPGNGFCLNLPPTARLARPGSDDVSWFLGNFSKVIDDKVVGSGWPNLGGGGLENIGANDAVHSIMLQILEGGAVSLFPAFPSDGDAAFESLRARGGFLIDAQHKGGVGVVEVEVKSEVGGTFKLTPFWQVNVTCATDAMDGELLKRTVHAEGRVVEFETAVGQRFAIIKCE